MSPFANSLLLIRWKCQAYFLGRLSSFVWKKKEDQSRFPGNILQFNLMCNRGVWVVPIRLMSSVVALKTVPQEKNNSISHLSTSAQCACVRMTKPTRDNEHYRRTTRLDVCFQSKVTFVFSSQEHDHFLTVTTSQRRSPNLIEVVTLTPTTLHQTRAIACVYCHLWTTFFYFIYFLFHKRLCFLNVFYISLIKSKIRVISCFD